MMKELMDIMNSAIEDARNSIKEIEKKRYDEERRKFTARLADVVRTTHSMPDLIWIEDEKKNVMILMMSNEGYTVYRVGNSCYMDTKEFRTTLGQCGVRFVEKALRPINN